MFSRYSIAVLLLIALSAIAIVPVQAFAKPTLQQIGVDELDVTPDNTEFDKAYANHAQKAMVSVKGQIRKILSDDNKGSRHQKFIITVNGKSVLIASNMDLVKKIPIDVGDEIVIKGEYIWNEKGGVIHWTHRDPRHQHPDGFIYYKGKLYQ